MVISVVRFAVALLPARFIVQVRTGRRDFDTEILRPDELDPAAMHNNEANRMRSTK